MAKAKKRVRKVENLKNLSKTREREIFKHEMRERITTVMELLEKAFAWHRTPWGAEYWATVYERLAIMAHPDGLH